MLGALGVAGPFVLVGFWVGGMVLIESSHEGQTPLLNDVFTWKVKLEGLVFYPKVVLSRQAPGRGHPR